MRCFLIVLVICWIAVPSRLSAETADQWLNRGNELRMKGEFDKAIVAYTQAVAAANPNDPGDKSTIFYAYLYRGFALSRKGERDKAITDYTKAVEIDRKSAYAYTLRGLAWDGNDRPDKAISDYSKAVSVDPKCAMAYGCRGNAWMHESEYSKALADYLKAVEIDPNRDSSYDGLASIYATCPDAKYRDGKKAVANAEKAHELSGGKIWHYLATLSAAYAENGDFAKARKWQAKAIELAPEVAKPNYRTRLELYEQGKSYHEQPVKK